MQNNQIAFNLNIDEKLFIKNPDTSELGEKIIQYSISLIDKIGFESFTFKKLAEKINTTEASIYRYFENKYKLLLYLLSWYWNWVENKMLYATYNISSSEERLKIAIAQLSRPIERDVNFRHVDEIALYHIVVSESAKVYLIKNVDELNQLGLFRSYKSLCGRVADIIKEINPDYSYSRALVSTIMESSHSQKFFAEHLPSLTEIPYNNLNLTTDFLTDVVLKTIKK